MEIVAVKTGIGDATFNMHPDLACESIKEGVIKGLKIRINAKWKLQKN